jgi:hypothetical protein
MTHPKVSFRVQPSRVNPDCRLPAAPRHETIVKQGLTGAGDYWSGVAGLPMARGAVEWRSDMATFL